MDRRNFLKCGGAAIIASQLSPLASLASPAPQYVKFSYRKPGDICLKLRFLGTGAADWNGPDERGEYRRLSSILLDNEVLVDFTDTSRDMLPEGVRPHTVFYTHSHGDHYNPKAALGVGVRKVFVGDTWIARCREDFEMTCSETGFPMPEITAVAVGQKIELENGISFTALPANHCTEDTNEQCLLYLIEKAQNRLLYATDTGGIICRAARIAGLDAHNSGNPITALVMEATMGLDFDDDYRLFTHSSVATVLRTTQVLMRTGRYVPVEGQQVFLTHMARTLHGTQAELDRNLPPLLKAAYDGLEICLR